jgi:hypothetical protein
LCEIVGNPTDSILQLKARVEVQCGLEAETLALCLPSRPLGENETLATCGLPSELYAVVLHTVDFAVAARASPGELTDDQLAEACASSAGQGEEYINLD